MNTPSPAPTEEVRLHLPVMIHVAASISPHAVLEFLGRCVSSMSAPLWLQAAKPVVDARVHEGGYNFVEDYESLSQRAHATQVRLLDENQVLRQLLAEATSELREIKRPTVCTPGMWQQ